MTDLKSFHSATPQGAKHTKTDVWLTPKWIIDKIGISDLGPCAWAPNGEMIVKTAVNYCTEEMNGLKADWSRYSSVFVNFPYSQPKEWMEKCVEEYMKGAQIIVLCFNRSDTRWFQDFAKYCTGINCVRGRVSFLTESGETKSNGNAPSILIAFGEDSFDRIKNVPGVIFRNTYNK